MTIEQLLRKRFGDVKTTGGDEIRVNCPFCGNGSNKYKMWVNPFKYHGIYHCWSCDKSGSVKALLGTGDFVVQKKQTEVKGTKEMRSPGTIIDINQVAHSNDAYRYLTSVRDRVFDVDYLTDTFGVKYCSKGYKFRMRGTEYNTANSLVFPIWMNNEIAGWQSRLVYDPAKLDDTTCAALGFPKEDGKYLRPSKYFTSTGMQKSQVLYNFDLAKRYPMVVLTEGVFDVFSVGPQAVAALGKDYHDNQISLIKTYWDHAVILLDPEDKTAKARRRLVKELSGVIEVTEVNLKYYSDPGSAPTEEIWRQIHGQIDADRKDKKQKGEKLC